MGFIINPYRLGDAGGGGGGGGCTTPNASYTGLALTQLTTSGCYRKPMLTATSVSHSLASDDDLRFWVNCKLGDDTTSTFGTPSCTSGSDLITGKLFTLGQLQSGIDLQNHDTTNAAAQDASDDIAIGWDVEIVAVDYSDCPSSICADASAQSFSTYESFAYDGPAVYDGSTFPAFNCDSNLALAIVSGSSSTYAIEATVTPWYWANSGSSGYDSLPSGLTVEIQFDTNCNTSGGCSSYSWTDADDNGSSFAVTSGGTGEEFTVTEADCWSEEYIFVRARIKSSGSCGTAAYSAWTTVGAAGAGELDVANEGGSCGPPGGGGPP